jgi:anti-anti-sigma factor
MTPGHGSLSDIRQQPVRPHDSNAKPPASSSAPFFVVPLDRASGFRLVGELDLSTVGLLLAALDTLPAGANVLDLAELSFMDASGLHALEQHAGSLNGADPLVLENVPAAIRRLFHLTGADLDPDIEIRSGTAGG